MNQSTSHQDGSPTITIKTTKLPSGAFQAQAANHPELPAVTAPSEKSAINQLRLKLDTAVKQNTLKSA